MISKKYNLSSRFFYSTLNRNEKKLYRQMVERIFQFKYEFELVEMKGWCNFFKAYDAVINDFPELFYVDFNPLRWEDVGRFKVAYKPLYTPEEVKKIHAKLEEISKKFDHITDSFELQEAVTEFICKEYKYSLEARGQKTSQERHTIVGLIKRKKGVCSAFSKLAQYIFQRHGIPVVYVVAKVKDAKVKDDIEEAHAWLAVKHGDSYYHWDITSIHSNYQEQETTQYASFNITDEEMSQGYIYPNEDYSTLKCDKTEYNYYHHKGLYYESYDEIREGVEKFVREMDVTKGINWFNFRIGKDIDDEKSRDYLLSANEVNELIKDTGYTFNKFESTFYRDGLGYYRCKFVTRKKEEFKLTVVQPNYHQESEPSKTIREFLLNELDKLEKNEIMVLPEYSNAGGINDIEKEKAEMQYADIMKESCSKKAREREGYVAVNVLEKRDGEIRNSTYLYNKAGEVSFIYDKIHLPPSEIDLGVKAGDGKCTCIVDGIRLAFMTCYDVYFSEQIEHIAKFKPDIIILCGYQRGEVASIINSQATLLAYRCNCFVLRSSYSMESDRLGGNSMIVAPIGEVRKNLGKDVGSISCTENVKAKCYRPAGFGRDFILNDKFVDDGLRPDIFK